MSEKKLGRGLDYLIKRTSAPDEDAGDPAPREVPVDAIVPNPYQPRREFDDEALAQLMESVKEHGVLQPIAVRSVPGGYEIISGERRWRVCQRLGHKMIPAVIRAADNQTMLELALVENIQRDDLGPIEKARAYRHLMRDFGLTQEQVAQRVSQKRSTVANHLRLLDLSDEIQGLVESGRLSMGHARALISVESRDVQRRLAHEAAEGKLTVRAIEDRARAQKPAASQRSNRKRSPHLDAIQRRIEDAIGTTTTIHGSLTKGRVALDYFDGEMLQRILDIVESGAAASRELRGDASTSG